MLTIILILVILNTSTSNDIIHFDWTSLANPRAILSMHHSSPTTPNNYIYHRHHHLEDRHDEPQDLQSDFGVFIPRTDSTRRPRFQTKTSYIQKIAQPTDETQHHINTMLKNYLNKLYQQKYHPDIQDDQESKFLDGSFWNFKNHSMKFANKFLSLFTVVQFSNSQCQATSSSGDYLGLCYHQTECDRLNGTAVGDCANGYGVCCVFKYSCGASSAQNCSYFESPNYPNYDPPGSMVRPPDTSTMPPGTTAGPSPTPDPRIKYYYHRSRWTRQADSSMSCFFNVFKVSNDVQQMRIDFIDLELRGPTNGTCMNERLIISGQNINDQIPVICGYNTGQHVYVDVSMLNGPLQLSVLSNSGERKRFKLRICQMTSTCANSNCLQYYTGVTGMISSFNYDQAAMFNRSTPGYFNNLNYAICIRKEAGYCSITYSNVAAQLEYPFELRNLDDANQNTVPPGQAGADIFNCPDDYIVIGGIRLCGYKFNDGAMIEDFTMNAPVTDTSAGPIVIPVRSNGAITGRGFKLFYTQNRCMTS